MAIVKNEQEAFATFLLFIKVFVLLSIESVLLIVLLAQLPIEKIDEELGHEVRVVHTVLPQLLFLISRQNEELKGSLE